MGSNSLHPRAIPEAERGCNELDPYVIPLRSKHHRRQQTHLLAP